MTLLSRANLLTWTQGMYMGFNDSPPSRMGTSKRSEPPSLISNSRSTSFTYTEVRKSSVKQSMVQCWWKCIVSWTRAVWCIYLCSPGRGRLRDFWGLDARSLLSPDTGWGRRETNHTKHLATIVSTICSALHEFVMRYMHLSIVTKIKCRKRWGQMKEWW